MCSRTKGVDTKGACTMKERGKMIAPYEQSVGEHPKKVRPTRVEHAKRIEFVRKMLTTGVSKAAIKRALRGTYDVRYRTAENYVARARERILQMTGKPRAEHVADSYEFYRKVQADPKEKCIVRLKARERIDKLLGLETPQRRELSGAGGQLEPDIGIEQSRANLLAIIDAELKRRELEPGDVVD